MTARNGEDTPPMPVRRRGVDVLKDGTDVSHLSERELLLNLGDSLIDLQHNDGQILGEIGRLSGRVTSLEQRLATGGDIHQRERQTSVTAIEELAPAVATELRKAMLDARDGHGNLTEARATEIMTRMLEKQKLAGFERGSKQREKLMWIVFGAIVAAVAAGAVGHFEGRATAPATQGHP